MKKQFYILILSFGLLLAPVVIFAQLFVDPEGNIGIGLEDSPNARMKILNSSENEGIGLLIENNSTLANIIGNKITISSLGLGEKIGIFSEVVHNTNATQRIYGLDLKVTTDGTGDAFGIRVTNSGSTTGNKYGISNIVGSNNTNSTKPVYGQFNFISVSGTRPAYGLYNVLTTNNNQEDQIGIYNVISGTGSGLKYGVYSVVNSGEGYAGYFLGDVQINGNLTYTSDENLKENIVNVDNALAIIGKLEPKSYNFKGGHQFGPSSNQKQYGFLAQQVENILPDIVKNVTQPAVVQATDGESTGLKEMEPAVDLKAIDYNALIAILTQGMKEQQIEIEALKNRVQELENK